MPAADFTARLSYHIRDVGLSFTQHNGRRQSNERGRIYMTPDEAQAKVDFRGSQPETPGMTIGPYKLLQQIGEGGMGVVLMAEQHEPFPPLSRSESHRPRHGHSASHEREDVEIRTFASFPVEFHCHCPSSSE
jgi:hypothetical protein